MKRKVLAVLFAGVLLLPSQVSAESEKVEADQIEKILSVYENVTRESILDEIEQYALYAGISEHEAAEEIYNELAEQQKLYEEEELSNDNGGFSTMSSDKVTIGKSDKGNIFYETSKTSGISHGHVGMYYSSATLVESMPKDGVRAIKRTSKKVDAGARIMRVSKLSDDKKAKAANWAYGRVDKDKYSYNFATNRSTSCYGNKNCSKLVWCAFKEKNDLDLDVNKGPGVYPKDIRDHERTVTVKKY